MKSNETGLFKKDRILLNKPVFSCIISMINLIGMKIFYFYCAEVTEGTGAGTGTGAVSDASAGASASSAGSACGC